MIIPILQKSQQKLRTEVISQGQVLKSVGLGLESRCLQLQIWGFLPSAEIHIASLYVLTQGPSPC